MRLGTLIKLGSVYFIRIIPYFEVKNLDSSVEWFQLLFRKIKLT